MKINANIPALQTSRHLNRTNDKIRSSLEKLSTGYKINNVADDPTGTAVSSKIKAQLYGLKIASKNAMDGVSLVQTAEGAMSEVHEMLKRMRELSVQASNDTNAPEDRKKAQMEIDQLIEAIDQMADVTEFNQMKLLNGSLSNLTTITDTAGNTSYDMAVNYMSPGFPTGEYQIEIDKMFEPATISVTLGSTGKVTLNGDTVELLPSDSDAERQNKITELAERYNLSLDPSTSWPSLSFISKEAGDVSAYTMYGDGVSAFSSIPGVDAEVTVSGFSGAETVTYEGNRIIITEKGGEQIQIDLTNASTAVGAIFNMKIEDKGQLKLQTGANEEQRIALMIPGLSTFALGLTKQSFDPGSTSTSTVNLVNVKNTGACQRSVELLDEAIGKISTMRATLGAYQNRLEHTVKSLDINSANTEESLSRINDTDMALEMSRYTLQNVILQSAISMLSQANERPQQLLQLLR